MLYHKSYQTDISACVINIQYLIATFANVIKFALFQRSLELTWNLSNVLHEQDSQLFTFYPRRRYKLRHFWQTFENGEIQTKGRPPEKKMLSFRHFPNFLPPSVHETCTTFSKRRNSRFKSHFWTTSSRQCPKESTFFLKA